MNKKCTILNAKKIEKINLKADKVKKNKVLELFGAKCFYDKI